MLIGEIKLLNCIDCGGDLKLQKYHLSNTIINHGLLECVSCARCYPIIDQVGIFFRREVLHEYLEQFEIDRIIEYGYSEALLNNVGKKKISMDAQVKVAKNWGSLFSDFNSLSDKKLLDDENSQGGITFMKRFIGIDFSLFAGKTIFIGCGGNGNETYHISKYKPAKIIVAEIGVQVYTIKKNIPEFESSLMLIRCDIAFHPVKEGTAEVSICNHALQHVKDWRAAYQKLVETTKEKGIISICVYSYEHNFIMTHIVEPSKVIIHLFPLRIIKWVSVFPAVMIYLVIRLIYKPISHISEIIARKLPLYEHMMFWSHSTFKYIFCNCYDLIHAPISYHFRENELRELSRANNVRIQKLENTFGTLWTMVVDKV